MWFGEPHVFPERGSPTILSMLGQKRYKGWLCRTNTTHWQALVCTGMAHNASSDMNNVAYNSKSTVQSVWLHMWLGTGLSVMFKSFCRLCPINLVK